MYWAVLIELVSYGYLSFRLDSMYVICPLVSRYIDVDRNVSCLDADLLAHDVYEPGSRSLNDIVEEFGDDILTLDNTIDRKKLGSIVFSDSNAMSVSTRIVFDFRLNNLWIRNIYIVDIYTEAGTNRVASCAH